MRQSSAGGSTASRMVAAFAAMVAAPLLLSGCVVAPASLPGKPADAVSAPAPASVPAAGEIVLPILVYHHVRPGATSTLFVSPEVFDEELNYLQYYGFHTISFTDLADSIEKGKPLPPNPIILSFDDGWENQYEYAFPILQKYHDTATFYVISDYLDHQNFMTTGQLKTMVAAGMTIGCHSRSHPYLTSLGRERAWEEIAGAKATLEAAGFTIDTFAYPYGAYNARVVDMVQEAGFRTARTVDAGTRVTAGNLEKLPGMTYQTFIKSYFTPATPPPADLPR